MNEITDLAQTMVDIVDAVCECLETTAQQDGEGNPVTATGAPTHCAVYWNTVPDDLDCGDCATNGGLYIWMEQMGSSAGSWPNPWTGPVAAAPDGFMVTARLALRLIRPCWPVVGSAGVLTPFPTRPTTEDHAINLAIDAATVYCCLLGEMQSRDPQGVFGRCSNVTAPALTPDPNRGGCAGFTTRFTVDLGGCCTPTMPAS